MKNNLQKVVLIGNPNVGKSQLFNSLTGLAQKVGNYPGVTIEKKSALISLGADAHNEKIEIIDLPGIYSLKPHAIDDKIAVQILLSKESKPDLYVIVVDATNLEKTLGLVLELRAFNVPILVALNMMDCAISRGLDIDIKKLSKLLDVPVIPTVATNKYELSELKKQIQNSLKQSKHITMVKENIVQVDLLERHKVISTILQEAVNSDIRVDRLSKRLDKILLHPLLGSIILVFIMLVMFQSVFSLAELPMRLIENGIEIIASFAAQNLPQGFINDLVVNGIIAGVGAVIIFLPQILILFLFINILEGSGYMVRASFLMHRLMTLSGLQGQAFVPLLSSFACTIPGIMATRSMRSHKQRLVTMLISPLMTCSAQLPVYVLLISAFIPDITVLGLFKLQALVMFALFSFGILSAFIVAKLIAIFTDKSESSSDFIMDMPQYRLPNTKNVLYSLWNRSLLFLNKAGKIIMLTSIVIYMLSSFPKTNNEPPKIDQSYVATVGKAIEPLFKPIGFDWKILTALIPGFAAREVFVGAIATLFSLEEVDASSNSLREKVKNTWPLPVGLALIAWYIFAPQCISTFAVMRRETNGYKWPVIMFTYLTILAYLAAFITYNLTVTLLKPS